MRRIDAGVEHRDGRARAVVPGGPRLIALDERDAVAEHRPDDRIVHHATHVRARAFERVQRAAVHVERDIRDGLESMNHAVGARGKPGEESRLKRVQPLPLAESRERVRQTAFSDVAAGNIQLDDDADASAAHGAIAQLIRNSRRAGRPLGKNRLIRQRQDNGRGDRRQPETKSCRGFGNDHPDMVVASSSFPPPRGRICTQPTRGLRKGAVPLFHLSRP